MFQAFKDLNVSLKLISTFLIIAIITAIVGLLGIYFTSSVAKEGHDVGAKLAPLADAAMEIKLNAVYGHLIFEEILVPLF